MEKKKSNKGLIVLVVILIVLLLGAVGYICYDKFMVKTEPVSSNDKKPVSDNVKSDDFYSISNLVKNHYIKKMTGTSSEGIKIKDGSVYYEKDMYSNKMVKDTTIKEKPVAVFSYSLAGPSSPLLFYVLTEDNNLYFRTQDSSISSESSEEGDYTFSIVSYFIKINPKKIVDVYVSYIDGSSTTTKVIGVDFGDGELYLHSIGGFTTTYRDIEYPDYQTKIATDVAEVWRLDKDKKLYSYVSTGEELRDGFYKEVTYNNKPVIAKDTFSIISGDGILDLVVDKDNNLLYVKKDNKNVLSLYKNSKVKDIKYSKEKEDIYYNYNVEFVFEDGSTLKSDGYAPSSLYLRNNS